MISRRAFAVAVVGLLAVGPAAAQDWPTRPVTMVVPFPPGGGTDVLGRIIGRRLSEILGQQVIIDNVGGAGGMIGSNKVAKATPDGYEFVLGSRADAINQTLYKHPLYDLKEDLVPVILVADQPMAMIARHDLPVDGLADFIAYVKKNQATMRTGSAGIGSTGYVDCALFNQAIGVKVQDIPYRGGGPALPRERRKVAPRRGAVAVDRRPSCGRPARGPGTRHPVLDGDRLRRVGAAPEPRGHSRGRPHNQGV